MGRAKRRKFSYHKFSVLVYPLRKCRKYMYDSLRVIALSQIQNLLNFWTRINLFGFLIVQQKIIFNSLVKLCCFWLENEKLSDESNADKSLFNINIFNLIVSVRKLDEICTSYSVHCSSVAATAVVKKHFHISRFSPLQHVCFPLKVSFCVNFRTTEKGKWEFIFCSTERISESQREKKNVVT